MAREPRSPAALFKAARLAGLLAIFALVALGAFSLAQAQETPAPTAPATAPSGSEPTVPAGVPGEAVIRLQLEATETPVPVGDTILATVSVENVEHLAGFDFTISYDEDELEPVESEGSDSTPSATIDPTLQPAEQPAIQVSQLGEFLQASERGAGDALFCQVPQASDGAVVVNCSTLGPPVCLGGAPGASGSGVLAVVAFESKGGGVTSLDLSASTLVLDDLAPPCDAETIGAQPIDHTTEGASIELAPKEDSSTTLYIIVGVVVVIAVLALGGFFGYRWYLGRQTAA